MISSYTGDAQTKKVRALWLLQRRPLENRKSWEPPSYGWNPNASMQELVYHCYGELRPLNHARVQQIKGQGEHQKRHSGLWYNPRIPQWKWDTISHGFDVTKLPRVITRITLEEPIENHRSVKLNVLEEKGRIPLVKVTMNSKIGPELHGN
ncbi:hypothetical protein Tco_0563773 [Tanacetum coccineum]